MPADLIYLVLVGSGPEEQRLKELTANLGIDRRVVFAGWTDRPWESLAGVDVFLMPSRTEALSLALCEAMASGCCTVASDVGGNSEVITRPDLGWIVPAEDPEKFLSAMTAAASLSAEERQTMGRRARDHVSTHFEQGKQLAALASLIEGKTATPNVSLEDLPDRTRPIGNR